MDDLWRYSSDRVCKSCVNWGGQSAANQVGPCKAHAPGPQGFPTTNGYEVCGDFSPADFYVPKEMLDLMKEVGFLRACRDDFKQIIFFAELFDALRKARLTRESNT